MKVALVYDRVNKFGGAERVLQTIHKIFPDAPLFTLVHDIHSAPWSSEFTVLPTFVNKIGFFKKKHEWLAPIAPLAFETHDLSDYEVIISITSSDAKAVITKPHQIHICYCLTPTRYFWSGEEEYGKDSKMRLLPGILKNYFRTVDLLISKRPDEYIAISGEVKNRIKKYYNRDSSVIYPSIDDKFYSNELVPVERREYYLLVGRLVPYKKADLAIKVFNKLKKKLIVIGTGSEKKYLESIAGKNITFVGSVDDDKLIDYYCHAKALIFPQEEDYGLVPIEAQACGTPVIAYAKGGALETIVDKKTGLFFKHQTIKSLGNCIGRFEKLSFKPKNCRDNAEKFREDQFTLKFKETINNLVNNYFGSK